ncbi:Solute carrier family 22 member 21 [Stylophora pistillata]|uniref:Solute carrier family 22 member 21 n=1 Tax=Stylophora pistillata TaxID=50429 RepID=A0A2B4RLZ6_STYPI|nr:Solute carrier family 22 member 21 [Stylophora pistillata]
MFNNEENKDYHAGKCVAFCERYAKEAGKDVADAEDNYIMPKEPTDRRMSLLVVGEASYSLSVRWKESSAKYQTRKHSAMSGKNPSISNFDDILTSVSSFGYLQRIIYLATCCLVIIPSCLQVIGLVFFAGTPKFHCVTPNVSCADSKCCTNCTDYVFDGPFTSSVSEWNLICDKAYVGANVQAVFSAGMLIGSLLFGATSDFFGRRFCIYICAALLAITSLGFPPLLIFTIYAIFPESARWLAAQGHLTQAQAVLMRFAGKGSSSIDSDALKHKLAEYHEGEVESKTIAYLTKNQSYLELLRSPRLRKRTVILCFNWLVISMVYYGFLLYVTRLDGNPYLNLFLMYLSDVPTHLINWVILQKFGRRIPYSAIMVIGGFICLLVLAVPEEQKGAITALAFIGRFMISGSFSNVYLYSTELYPTILRNQGIGICSTSARVGSLIAPYIVMLAQLPEVSATLPMVVFGSLAVAAGLLALFLPETLRSNMAQTVEEINKNKEFYGMVCMGKPRPCPLPCPCCSSEGSGNDPSSVPFQI